VHLSSVPVVITEVHELIFYTRLIHVLFQVRHGDATEFITPEPLSIGPTWM